MPSTNASKAKAMERCWRRGSSPEPASSATRWNSSTWRSSSTPSSSPSSSNSSPSSSPSLTPSIPFDSSAEQSRRGSSGTNWRANPLGPASKPSFKDLQLGTVLRLDEPDEESILKARTSSDQRPWDHPVVVIGKSIRNGQELVTFRVCTSFHGQGIEAGRRTEYHRQYVLAENREDNTPPSGTQLARMEPGCRGSFKKRTYICITRYNVFTAEYKWLDLNGKHMQRFDAATTERLKVGLM